MLGIIGAGGIRNCYSCYDITYPELGSLCIIKFFQDKARHKDLEYHKREIRTHYQALEYTRKFYQRIGECSIKCSQFFYLPAWIVELSQNKYANVEPFISEIEQAAKKRELDKLPELQALVHFTYIESKGNEILGDIQGWKGILTDPQIHSKYATWNFYATGNGGPAEIIKFEKTHRCNEICQKLKLQALETLEP